MSNQYICMPCRDGKHRQCAAPRHCDCAAAGHTLTP